MSNVTVSRKDAAKILGVSPQTLTNLVKAGKISAENRGLKGRQYLVFKPTDLRAYKKEHGIKVVTVTNGHDAAPYDGPRLLTAIMTELRLLRQDMDYLKKIWS